MKRLSRSVVLLLFLLVVPTLITGCASLSGEGGLLTEVVQNPRTAGELAAAAYLLARPHLSDDQIAAARVAYDTFGMIVVSGQTGDTDLQGVITPLIAAQLSDRPELIPLTTIVIGQAMPFLTRHLGDGQTLDERRAVIAEFYDGLSATIELYLAAVEGGAGPPSDGG